MKKLILILTTLVFGLFGCKNNEEVVITPQDKGEKRIIEFCSGDEYLTNKQFFRSSATGTSYDREIAKKIARQNAENALARSISVVVETVAENQATQLGFNTTEEATSKFNELSRSIVNQQLQGAYVICQTITITEDNKYVAYVSLELGGQDIISKYSESLRQDERIRAEYNYDQFKDTFEQVMEKYRN
jgi:hypothetical protein